MPTYDELINNEQFLSDLYDVYTELEYDLPETNRDAVNDFLSRRRAFEDNIIGTANYADDWTGLSDEGKQKFANVYQQVEEMPGIFEEGGAPLASGLKDHILYSISDPTNILGAVGGIFTGGAATAGTFAAKEAAKRGVQSLLKNRLRAAVSAPVLKAAGVDAAVSGLGGSAREALIQNTEKDVGVRDEYDPMMIAATGVVEGPASVIGGGALGLTARIMANMGSKATRAILPDSGMISNESLDKIGNRLTTLFVPGGGLSEDVVRASEIAGARQADIERRNIDLGRRLEADESYQKIYGSGVKKDINLLNEAASGDEKAIDQLSNRFGTDLTDKLYEARDLIREAQEFGLTVDGLNPKTIQIFDPKSGGYNPTYLRKTYEAFELKDRRPVSYDNFIKNNPSALNNLYKTLKADLELGEKETMKYVESFGLDPAMFNTKNINTRVRDLLSKRAKNLYEGDIGKFDYGATLTTPRKELDPAIEKFLGPDKDIARRIMRSVEGIIEPMTQLHRANEIGRILELEGRAAYAPDANAAARKLSQQLGETVDPADLVPVHSNRVLPGKNQLRSQDGNYYVTKSMGDRLNLVVENPALRIKNAEGPYRVLNNALETMSFLQGAIKGGKTVYSPTAHVPNFGGMGTSVIAGGNLRAVSDYLTKYARDPAKREELNQLFTQLGIRDTGVNLNQMMSRLGPDFDRPGVSSSRIEEVARSIVGAGKLGRGARKIYQLTDDVGKLAAFIGEREKMKNIWRDATPEYRDYLTKQAEKTFRKKIGRDKAGNVITEEIYDMTEDTILNELAARKALNIMPVYSRIPMFTEYMRGVPVVGNFVAFPAEIYRNVYKMLKTGHEEMIDGFATGNNSLVKAGANRLASLAAVNAGINGGVYAANEIAGFSDIASAMKDYLSYDKYNPILITDVEGEGKKRKIKYRDLGYVNPYNDIMQVVDAVSTASITGKPVDDVLAERLPVAMSKMFLPFVDESLALQAGREMFNAARADDDRTAMYHMGQVYRTLEPGFAKIAREMATEADMLPPQTEQLLSPRYYGAERQGEIKDMSDVMDYFMRIGIPTMAPERTFEVDATTGFALRSQAKDLSGEWNSFSNNLRQLMRDPSYTGRLDIRELAKEYEDELGRQVGVQANMSDLLTDLKVLTGSDDAVDEVLRDRDLKKAFPVSQRTKLQLLRDRSNVQRLSGNMEFWRDIAETNPEFGLQQISIVRKLFRQIEDHYDNKNLTSGNPEELPDPIFQ